MPDSFSIELRSLLAGLLHREVAKRLGCRGRGADEIKSHPFFRGIDWRVVYLQRLAPPLIPARGEVNAADAFDIGSFDDEDTKHIKLSEADQELYRNFPVVVSERWQHEIAETIFDYINHEADKAEMKRKSKHNKLGFLGEEQQQTDCILHGYIKRLGGTFTATWLTRYVRLYPNRLELWSDSGKQPELIFMDQIEEVCNDFVQIKQEHCIVIKLYNHSKYVLTNSDEIGLKEWHVSLKAAHRESLDMMTTMAEKATKIYGTEIPLKHMGKRRQQLQHEANNSGGAGGLAAVSAAGVAANWEQKIIQKELQASSSSKLSASSKPAAVVVASATPTAPTTGDSLPTKRPPDSLQQQQQPSIVATNQPAGATAAALTGHKHRAHYSSTSSGSHRSHHHHHRHHHHHHHHQQPQPQSAGDSQAASGHQHHHHHHHAHHSRTSSTSSAAQQHRRRQQAARADLSPPSTSTPTPTPTTPAAQVVSANMGVDEAQLKVATSAAEHAEGKPQQVEGPPGDASAANESKDMNDELRKEKDHQAATTTTGILGEQSENIKPDSGATSSNEDEDEEESSGSESDSQSSASCTSSANSDQANGKAQTARDSLPDSTAKLSISDEGIEAPPPPPLLLPRPTVDTAMKTATTTATNTNVAKSDETPKAKDKRSETVLLNATPDDDEEAGGRVKLAVSLENVSDQQQEVLRDPSKRITSDNKQRELDLVAQYEKLNVSARNSSSSVEEDQALKSIG